MQNHLTFGKPTKRDDGTYVMSRPWPTADKKTLVPLVDNDDIGKYLQPFLDDPGKYAGTGLTASTAFYTPIEMCETWSKVTGAEVVFEGASDQLLEVSAAKDSQYYGSGSKRALGWTLAQMEEVPSSWEEFVRKHEPWFS